MKSTTLHRRWSVALAVSSALASQAFAAEPIWFVADQDAQQTLAQIQGLTLTAPASLSANGKVIGRMDEKQVNKLSTLMHENHKRCGGFTAHASEQEALLASQIPATLATFTAPPISQDAKVNSAIAGVSAARIINTITSMSQFTNRYYTSTHGDNAAAWVATEWQNLTADKAWASVARYNHASWAQDSVIVTLQGIEFPDEIIVVGGHLDSINGSNTSANAVAPGADDNASGVAAVTEVLRALLAQGQPKRTIKLMGYAAEEVGLRGSQAIANEAKNAGSNVKAVLQLDMTAYKGSTADIVFMTDYTDSNLNNYMMQLLDHYLPSVQYTTDVCGYGCSDHASWHNAGYPATMPFESRMSQHNSAIHTVNDTLAQFNSSGDHAAKFAKLGAAFAIELGFAGAGTDPDPDTPANFELGVPLTGLAASTGSNLQYSIDIPASSSITFTMSGGSGDADLYVRKDAAPTSSSYDCRPYKSGNSETCTFTPGTAGRYYVMLNAYASFSGVSLLANAETTEPPVGNSGSESNLSAAKSAWLYRELTLPSGVSSLTVNINGGSGDADLYLKSGSQPTTSSYTCRPYKNGNTESCVINNPAAGSWFIGIRAYSAFSGLNLDWQYQ